jgi:carboxypeptidase C (cathepsin A)
MSAIIRIAATALLTASLAAPPLPALAQPAQSSAQQSVQHGERRGAAPSAAGGPSQPAPGAPSPSPAPAALPADKTTTHTLRLPDGRTLEFTATAGTIRLTNQESGAPIADMAYIAFQAPSSDKAARPVTFAMNGGPGYASAWLNLGAMGPWRLPMDEQDARPSASPVTQPNAQTWLPFTDLVFLDPAGTGYSRVLGGDDARKALWSVNGDIDSLATTIRRWSEANGRTASPKFIAGESYGGFRAPKIAHRLQVDQGVGVAGLVLVSPVFDFSRVQSRGGVLEHVARLPSYAAAHRLRAKPITRADMADVETYARGAFLADLMAGVKDEAALARLGERVTSLTGLPADVVRRRAARIPMETYLEEIRRTDGRVVSMYDANVTGLDPSPFGVGPDAQDQMRLGLHAPIIQAMVGLYRNELEWVVPNGRYFFQNEQAGRQWDWGNRGRQEAVRDFTSAMALDPAMRTLIAHGLTDLVTPYFETQMVLDQTPTPGDPARIRFEVYPGGHMFYSREDSRRQFHNDARSMIEAATKR